jgi:hypothetical protein
MRTDRTPYKAHHQQISPGWVIFLQLAMQAGRLAGRRGVLCICLFSGLTRQVIPLYQGSLISSCAVPRDLALPGPREGALPKLPRLDRRSRALSCSNGNKNRLMTTVKETEQKNNYMITGKNTK